MSDWTREMRESDQVSGATVQSSTFSPGILRKSDRFLESSMASLQGR